MTFITARISDARRRDPRPFRAAARAQPDRWAPCLLVMAPNEGRPAVRPGLIAVFARESGDVDARKSSEQVSHNGLKLGT
jgi:hypothetical protein